MKKNKKSVSKGKNLRQSKDFDKKRESLTRVKSAQSINKSFHQMDQKQMKVVMESYYNLHLQPDPDTVTTGSSFTLREDPSTKGSKMQSLNTKVALQKVISKNAFEQTEEPQTGKKPNRKSKKSQHSSSKKNTTQKCKYLKGVQLKEPQQYSDSYLQKMDKSLQRERKFRKIEIRNRSFEQKGKNRKASGKKFQRKNSNVYLKTDKNDKSKKKNNKKIANTTVLNSGKKKKKTAEVNMEDSLDQKNISTVLQQCQESERLDEVKRLYINLLSIICGELTLTRQTYELAFLYFTKNMRKLLDEPAKLQTLVLSSIILALKVDESSIAKPLFREIVAMENPNKGGYSLDNSKRNESIKESKELTNREQFLRKINLCKKRPNIRIEAYIKKIPELLTEKEVYIPRKPELLEMEKFICKNMGFRLIPKTMSYCIDYLTFRWDDFIVREWKKDEATLCFRYPGETLKLSYLIQIVNFFLLEESSEVDPSYFILTTMYLLVRTKLEEKNSDRSFGLQSLKQNLRKSTNILYIDSVGSNIVFTKYLEQIGFKMERIAKTCQIMPQYLEQTLFESFNFRKDGKVNSHQEGVLIHQHNPKIYSYFNYDNIYDTASS